ncbi:FAD-dependent oxidoreductase [Candidatus Latescibacterota bacterium]
MDRRKFFGVNASIAAGSAFTGKPSFARAADNGTVRERAKDIEVLDSADIIILGGGPAGCGAAIAAGRLGLDVLLVERYGYLGGMATGGLVIGYFEYNRGMKGITSEFVDRITADGGRWVETNRVATHEPFFNPEVFQYMCLDMTQKANVRHLLHAWAVETTMKNGNIESVIIESKSGRKALKAKMVIDCTGDGDSAEWTGVPFESSVEPNSLGLDFMYRDVDFDKLRYFQTYEPEKWKKISADANKQGFGWRPWYIGWGDLAWFNTFFEGDPTDVRDLTACEIDLRTKINKHIAFYRKNVPGFENAKINKIACQTGCRVSRRILGEHFITMDELKGKTIPNSVGKMCPLKEGDLVDVPYGALVPQKVDNLLYAGRCISGTVDVIQRIRSISSCVVFGQAAGTAATLSIRDGIAPRNLDIAKLQSALKKQGVDV